MSQYGSTITDIDIPFGRMVVITLRLMFASIVALLVLGLLLVAIVALITVIRGGNIGDLLKQIPG